MFKLIKPRTIADHSTKDGHFLSTEAFHFVRSLEAGGRAVRGIHADNLLPTTQAHSMTPAADQGLIARALDRLHRTRVIPPGWPRAIVVARHEAHDTPYLARIRA